nr:MAG TPA: hypothetical protein [Caudoviricetes sp.]
MEYFLQRVLIKFHMIKQSMQTNVKSEPLLTLVFY